MKTQLLCTFTRRNRFYDTVKLIIECNEIVFDKILKVKKVPVIMHNSTSHLTFDDLFVACNEDTMKMNACQELERYLNGAKVKTSTYYAIKKYTNRIY